MTAINITLQPLHNCLHVVSDGAAYDEAGIIKGFASKVFPQPQWPGIISARGGVVAHNLVAEDLAFRFQTFDEVADGIAAVYREICHDHGAADKNLELFIAGWSSARKCPEVYLINSSAKKLPLGVTKEQLSARAATGQFVPPPPFVLTNVGPVIEAPALSLEIRRAAYCSGVGINEKPERCIQRMHLALECQRHDVHEGVDRHFIGGFAQLTTVTPDGISQRILSRWPEDKVGQLIRPRAANWQKFKAEHWSGMDYDPIDNPWGFDPETRERFNTLFQPRTSKVNYLKCQTSSLH